MCVGLPGRVVEVVDPEHGIVRVDIAGSMSTVSAGIVLSDGEQVEVGDWLEIHMGHALAKIDEAAAKEVLAFFDELDAAHFQPRGDEPAD
jgi:hydrogenase expression/formation protein HypC